MATQSNVPLTPADKSNLREISENPAVTSALENQGQTVDETHEVLQDEPRILAGLQEGRIVDYRLKDSIVRPAVVVCAGDRTGLVALAVFFKGIADLPHLPRPLPVMASGHTPDNLVLVLDVPYEEMYTPDSWGWPAKQAVRAASVDPAGIEPIIIALIEPIIERQYNRLLAVVNEKLEAHNESVADAIAKHGQVLVEATDKLLAGAGSAGAVTGMTAINPIPPVPHNHMPDAPCAAESCPAFDPSAPTGQTSQAAEAQANSAASTKGGPSAS